MTLSSTGPSATKCSSYMGKYTQVSEKIANERPVWQKDTDTTLFLYYATNKYWIFSPTITDTKGAIYALDSEMIPETGWKYVIGGGKFEDDLEIKVVGDWSVNSIEYTISTVYHQKEEITKLNTEIINQKDEITGLTAEIEKQDEIMNNFKHDIEIVLSRVLRNANIGSLSSLLWGK